MTDCKRNGKRWTTPEILTLHREHDLLKLTPQEIANKHKRSLDSILYMLHAEGFTIEPKNNIILEELELKSDSDSDYQEEEEEEEKECDNVSECSSAYDGCLECDMDNLSNRVWNLESNLEEIHSMVKQMFDEMKNKKTPKKLAPLRKYL